MSFFLGWKNYNSKRVDSKNLKKIRKMFQSKDNDTKNYGANRRWRALEGCRLDVDSPICIFCKNTNRPHLRFTVNDFTWSATGVRYIFYLHFWHCAVVRWHFFFFFSKHCESTKKRTITFIYHTMTQSPAKYSRTLIIRMIMPCMAASALVHAQNRKVTSSDIEYNVKWTCLYHVVFNTEYWRSIRI